MTDCDVIYVRDMGRSVTALPTELSTLDPSTLLPVRLKRVGSARGAPPTLEHAPRPRNYRGQTHIGGSYWFTRCSRRLPHDSRLEHLRLQVADLDPDTVSAVTWPFALVVRHLGKSFVHVPDLLLHRRRQGKLLVDVRPRALQHDPRSQLAFQATREACALAGLDYEVWGGLSAVETYNVSWLAGFRRQPLGFNLVADALLNLALHDELTIEDLSCEVTPRYFVRPALFHLMWCGDLRFDLTRPLRETTPVIPGPGARRSVT